MGKVMRAAGSDTQVKGMSRVLVDVVTERHRQDAKWGEQNHVDGTGPDTQWVPWPDFGGMNAVDVGTFLRDRCQERAAMGHVTWLDIALEEFAEALAEEDEEKLRAELVQSIAVQVAWVEAIDRRTREQH